MAKRRPAKRSALQAPGRGKKISTELTAKFREAYLRFGYMTAAANEVKLPPTSCVRLVEEAESDPEFVAARRLLLTRGLDRVETMMIRSAEIATERIEAGPTVDAMGGIVDNGPQYFRGLSDAHRSLVARKAKETPDEAGKAGPVEVRITVKAADAIGAEQVPAPADSGA